MEFKIEKNILLKSLEEVIRAIDSNNIYIHLRNFYISILDEAIIIKGSNGYFSIESKINGNNVGNIKSIGSFLVPASLFINVIKKCNGSLEIKEENNILKIKNNKDEFEINLLSVEDYPSIDFSLYGNKIKINAEKLRSGIERVIFATSQTNEEMILTGVNIKYENSKLLLTATDGYRLAREIIDIEDDRNISFDVTITNKNIKNFIPSEIKGEIVMYVNEHKINIIHGTTNFQSKIIDAPYKMVSQIFERTFTKQLLIEKTILSNAINKASVLSNETSNNKIKIIIKNNEINLSTGNEEVGRTSVIIESNDFEYNGEEITIVFNNKYLKEAISVFNDKIKINLTNSKEPIKIECDKLSNIQIISPMSN